jgi:hypothetical protein
VEIKRLLSFIPESCYFPICLPGRIRVVFIGTPPKPRFTGVWEPHIKNPAYASNFITTSQIEKSSDFIGHFSRI